MVTTVPAPADRLHPCHSLHNMFVLTPLWCRAAAPGRGQSGERILTLIRHPGAVTEELVAAVDGGAL